MISLYRSSHSFGRASAFAQFSPCVSCDISTPLRLARSLGCFKWYRMIPGRLHRIPSFAFNKTTVTKVLDVPGRCCKASEARLYKDESCLIFINNTQPSAAIYSDIKVTQQIKFLRFLFDKNEPTSNNWCTEADKLRNVSCEYGNLKF